MRPSWAKNYKRKTAVTVTPEIERTANSVAAAYRTFLKTNQPFAQPWHPSTPPKDTQFWGAFVKAAEIIIELGATPHDYVQAQWEGIKKIAKHRSDRMLFPQMLITDNARLRYLSFADTQTNKAKRTVTKKQLVNADPFMRDNRRLKKLMKDYDGVEECEVIKLHCLDFSRGFLKSKGVWSDVASEYESSLS
jgi:hypothetical protein